MNTEFTEKENYWIKNLLRGEQILDSAKNKSDVWITDAYLNYLDLIIKYGNLRPPTDEDEYKKLTRVVKINKVIPKKVLNAKNYHYVLFNGLYVVQDVVFCKAEHCKAILNKQLNDNENLKEEELLLSSAQVMVFENGEKWLVFLVKSKFTKDFLGYAQTYWSYAYIYDDGDFV